MFEMHFTVETWGRSVLLSGRLDARSAPDFEKAALAAADEQPEKRLHMLLDFSGLEYISSAGLRSILVLAKRLSPSGGKVVLCGMSGVVEEVFGVSGFDSFLPVTKSREEALRLLGE
ncbi:MAG TPA: STAS domain-containing protein [Synergistales bacterium]|jgi:anti-anti-sigma factor|nr:STAS domain-containing protein [Synergistaceae bacterium]HOO88446.1 STAS domain-containing protein [Synergistales bacterium]HPE64744.1 STAS domain-containing protein [Synergistales bacterium]HRV97735.1 STAS domain-containing protein [Aminobacteriaceae bacterium]